ncbi:MAG: hypothetical protein U0W40_15165 [Acidimicrobiia bacterium]
MNSEPTPANRSNVEWGPVGRGALVGLCVLVAASILAAILDHNIRNFDDSGWKLPLFVAILVGYGLAGFVAGRGTPDSPYTNGLLAGVGAFVLWVPVRIVIWLVRDEHKGLFTGHSPALRPGQVFGQVVIAAGLGMLGGWLGARAAQRARS